MPFRYKKMISALEVEISDDMFIIKAEEAEKHIKPPELTRIVVSPTSFSLKPGNKQTVTAKGFDQFGRDIPISKLDWSATGGEIDSKGVYRAGDDEGNFLIIAKSEKVCGEATVTISREREVHEPPEQPKPIRACTLSWSGEIPAQKWMNFYTRVLTRFVKSGKLKINVMFETSSEEGIHDLHVEETKSALEELGLDDTIKVNKGE